MYVLFLLKVALLIFLSKRILMNKNELKKLSFNSTLKKAFKGNLNFRICLHKSLKDKYQEMIIVQDKKTLTLPHKHKQSGETINLLHGRLKIILYDKRFKIKKKYILNSKKPKIFRLPEDTFHSYDILSDYVIYLETKAGPFVRKSNFILMNNLSK